MCAQPERCGEEFEDSREIREIRERGGGGGEVGVMKEQEKMINASRSSWSL
jgi:hypothetical protein